MTEIPASNSVKIPSMKSESAAGDRNSGGFRIQPPLQYHPPSKIVLADLNVDPPDSDGNDSVPIAAVSPACLSSKIPQVRSGEGKVLPRGGRDRDAVSEDS
ncbi:hypothetical protein BC332_16707 [Capsicum chinense]|nr:hypothetical protein BC332_16707 [Capsicum chinense]